MGYTTFITDFFMNSGYSYDFIPTLIEIILSICMIYLIYKMLQYIYKFIIGDTN